MPRSLDIKRPIHLFVSLRSTSKLLSIIYLFSELFQPAPDSQDDGLYAQIATVYMSQLLALLFLSASPQVSNVLSASSTVCAYLNDLITVARNTPIKAHDNLVTHLRMEAEHMARMPLRVTLPLVLCV